MTDQTTSEQEVEKPKRGRPRKTQAEKDETKRKRKEKQEAKKRAKVEIKTFIGPNESPDPLVSIDTLLKRYRAFSTVDNQDLSKRAIYGWRKHKGFPDPVVQRPRLVWKFADVRAWELEQGWDFLQ